MGVCSSSNAQTPQPAPTISARSSLVVIPALVHDKSGRLVYALNPEEFTLTDDGVPQKLLLDEDAGGEPLAMVVVIETGGDGSREFQRFQSIAPALPPMLESVIGNVPHRIAVVTFDSHPTLLQPFTQDIDTASEAIRSLQPDCTRQHHLDDCKSPLAVRNLPLGDNGAAILDSIGYAVDLLRSQPAAYRRSILLISETLDRGSHLTLEEGLRAINDTNTTIYSIGFSTGKSEAAHYASRELPTQPGGLGLENPTPNPPHGCMGKDPHPDPDASQNTAVRLYDCATQLVPPLAFTKMAAIMATDGLKRNVPETVARLTGGEYFKLKSPQQLENDLATISNHIPNRYVLSFQPQSPHSGLHAIQLQLPDYPDLQLIYRQSYWAEDNSVSPGRALPK